MTKTLDSFIEKELNDSEFATLYEAETERLESAVALVKAREEAGLTQAELAKLSGKTQATISRMEKGQISSFEVLQTLVHAMGGTLKIEIDFA
ncbi:helix-turn-helix domain-containing protein [Convivina intestini]|uniref:helix-turn-helix domain-containing protein n=1 Tax=Convivina intestini TaxID=1505726 RepID=UPI003B838667